MSQRIEITIAWPTQSITDDEWSLFYEIIMAQFPNLDWSFDVGVDCSMVTISTNVSNGFDEFEFRGVMLGIEEEGLSFIPNLQLSARIL